MDFHILRILFQKDPSYKCQFCIIVRAPSRMVSEVWEKYKNVPTKMLKGDARTNSVTEQYKQDLCLNSTNKLAKER